MPADGLLGRLAQELAEYSTVVVRSYWEGRGLWICPKKVGGFDVGIDVDGQYLTITSPVYDERFSDRRLALKYALSLLTSETRLMRVTRGDELVCREIQYRRGFRWTTGTRVSGAFMPFWKKKHVEVFQNDALSKPQTELICSNVLDS